MTQVRNVNTTDIRAAIELGCRTMQRVFNADDNMVPFFGSIVYPSAALKFHKCHSEAHVPGRHLNALLSAEHAVGIEVDEAAVDNHRRAAFFSYSGPVALPLNRQTMIGPLVNFCAHNLREGFHALYALTRFRRDAQARELAERNIAAVTEFWTPERGWDVTRLEALGLNFQKSQGFVAGEGRMLGPLVKYFRATGFGPALELALVLKEKAVGEFYLADGRYDPERFITRHSHSITCMMSSLAQLADLLGDAALLARVKAFYDNGLWAMRDEIGWSPETVGQQGSDHGEANNSGDILETALILGRWGYPEYYHDSERILRCHLLPSQLRDVSFIQNPPNPTGVDGLRDLADRHLGAYGFPAPYGHQSIGGKGRVNVSFNMDIVGGTVGSLCEAYREVARSGSAGHRVNLLFDHDTDTVRVESPYTHDALRVEIKQPGPLFVRIPPWVDRKEIEVAGHDNALWTNGCLFFSKVNAGESVRLRFPLKDSEMVLPQGIHVNPIRVKLHGDAPVAMDNFGAHLAFFDPIMTETRETKRVQVFVLTGQSNSLGTTSDPAERDISPGVDPLDAAIPFFWCNRSTRAGDGPAMSYGSSDGRIVTLQAQQGEGADPQFWGPEIGFGRRLAAAGVANILIIKASRGGGGNGYWLKGSPDDQMYWHVVKTVRQAVSALPKDTNFHIAALLYVQGESDSSAEAGASAERLMTLARHLREDLPHAAEMKVVVGGIAAAGPNRDIVRARQSHLPAVDRTFRYIDTLDLQPQLYDQLHFNKSAKLELGRRMADAWLAWAKEIP